MKPKRRFVLLFSAAGLAGGAHAFLAATAPARPAAPVADTVPLLPGLGTYTRPVGTRVVEAQQYFDQGLRLLYAFNHAEASRAFRAAISHDSTLAMAHWGLALTASPYLDRPRSGARDHTARASALRARALAGDEPGPDRGLIEALTERFRDTVTPGAMLDTLYSLRLAELHARHPTDPDIATFYGESLMLIRRRSYWSEDGSLHPGVAAARAAFEEAMRGHRSHPGANHLYVHLFEAAPDPRPALAAAERLRTLAPGAGHLLHMSSHIFFRVGLYAKAVEANRRAWEADRVYFRLARPDTAAAYVTGYHLHTLHFLWSALAMQHMDAEAIAVAESLAARISRPAADASVYRQSWSSAPTMAAARFEAWDVLRRRPAPPDSQPYARLLWHHASGLAAAAEGRIEAAERHLDRLLAARAALPPNAVVAPTSRAEPLARIATLMLRARIAEARGDVDSAVASLEAAIAIQDSLGHMEPPPWYIPVRQALGAMLLRNGRLREAERIFQEDLHMHPANPWSLEGIARARGEHAK